MVFARCKNVGGRVAAGKKGGTVSAWSETIETQGGSVYRALVQKKALERVLKQRMKVVMPEAVGLMLCSWTDGN